MAKKPSQKQQSFPFKGFLDVALTKEQLAGQKSWNPSLEELMQGLQRLTEDDLGVKFRWDTHNRCHMATASPISPDHECAGWYLSGRGSTPEKALKQLLYIHFVMWNGAWPIHNLEKARREDYE